MNELITIGQITAPHGVRGWVRVYPLTDFPERFEDLDAVTVLRGSTYSLFHVEDVEIRKNTVAVKFSECDSRDDAEVLRGAYLQVSRGELVQLPPGQYFVFDIIGLKVLDIHGQFVGTVTDVIRTGSNDVYVVRPSNKSCRSQDILVPAIKEIVRDIDLKNGVMVIELMDGM